MIIDSNTGSLLFDIGSVDSALKEQEFLESALGESAAQVRTTATGNWYQIWRSGDSEREIGVVIGFVPSGKIQQARIAFVKHETRAAGVAGWSREVENEMKEFHDGWLRRQLGDPPYSFHWGHVTSVIDEHDYSAVIIVVYKPRPQIPHYLN